MEEAAEQINCLPLSFKSPKEQEYIAFLWDAFETGEGLYPITAFPIRPRQRRTR